jgi:hypothetical protein
MNRNYCILSEDTSDSNFIKIRLNCFILYGFINYF